MKRLVFDLDGTITYDEPGVPYPEKRPREDIVAMLREYKERGFTIIIASSRNMRTHANSIGLINAKTLPIILDTGTRLRGRAKSFNPRESRCQINRNFALKADCWARGKGRPWFARTHLR